MILSVESWDGHDIQDSNYAAYFPQGTIMLGPSSTPVYVNLAYNPAAYTSTQRNRGVIPLEIKLLGTIHSQMDTLRQWFDVTAGEERKLLVSDTANSNKQWYVMAVAFQFTELDGQTVQILLDVADQIWYAETATTTAWSVTSDGDTQVVANAGNYRAAPVLTITPTSNKTIGAGGQAGANLYKAFFAVKGVGVNTSDGAAANLPFDVANNAWNTAALIADNSNKCQLNGGINNSVTTIAYDTVTGSLPSAGMGYVDTEQISWTGKTGTTSGDLTGVVRGIGGTSAASHLDNAEVKVSYLQADGRDIRVTMDGIEVDRWLDGINTTTSSIWLVISRINHYHLLSTGTKPILGVAIAGAGAITTITCQNVANFNGWNLLPNSGIVQIGSEIFTYTSRTGDGVQPPRFGGVTRATKGSAEGAHSIGDQVYWIEHDIQMTFGDPTLAAPTIPDSRKPMIDLANSTNSSHVWTEFFDTTGTRPLAWIPTQTVPNQPQNTSRYYTGNRSASANPATEAGMGIIAYQSGSNWLSPDCNIRWTLVEPVGFTAVTAVGEKYRVAGTWPSMKCYASHYGVFAQTMWTEATPASASTWTSWASHSAVAYTDYALAINLWLEFSGSVALSSGALAYSECESVTLALYSSLVAAVEMFITAPGPATPTNYDINCTITNNTTGASINVRFNMDLNEDLEIDCANHTVTYLKDNSPAIGAVTPATQDSYDWLSLDPGNNTLQWDEDGVVAVTVSVYQRDRMI